MSDRPDASNPYHGMADPELVLRDQSRLDIINKSYELPTMPTIRNPVVESVESNYANEFHDRLTKMIKEFDEDLDDSFEVGVRLVSFGQTVVFHLEDLGYYNPSLITFSGKTANGEPVELIQHVTQVSVLLMKLPRMNPEQPKRPFGFQAHPQDASSDGELY